VTVHGTRFTVEAVQMEGGANAIYTRVIVREGVVAVEHDGRTTELFAGDRWSSASEAPKAEAHVASAPRVGTPRSIARTTPNPAGTSTLAAENALVQRALTASRQGDDTRAVALFDDLIARYPHSPLEPNAEVERFRALQRLGKVAQAAKQARRYLGEHPDGMGSDEARRVAVEPIAPASNGSAERAR
jgi:TolA-binding protein